MEFGRSSILGPEYCIEQVARDSKVHFYTVFEDSAMFKMVFDHLFPVASRMQYWKGDKETLRENPKDISVEFEDEAQKAGLTTLRRGPARKLLLEQEFLLVSMKFKSDLLIQDLAYRFGVSVGLVTSILYTWIRVMSLEFRGLIKWADRSAVMRYRPDGFRKYFPKCRVIIDCTEVFIETPSSLELAAICWSQYKHH
eukprot:gene7350-13081_t